MGYFKIGKHKVFYSDDRFVEVSKPFFKELSASDIMGLKILGINGKPNNNAVELTNRCSKKLKDDHSTLSKQKFISKWVEFEFKDEGAQAIAWDVIYDYFYLHKNGWIVDLRDFDKKLKDDYSGKNYAYPQGALIGLQFNISANSFISRLFSKNILTFTLNLVSIKYIKGSLSHLEIRTDSKEIILGREIKIIDRSDG